MFGEVLSINTPAASADKFSSETIMKTIALQTNLMPVRRVTMPRIPKAGLSLILAMIGLAAGGIMIQTVPPSGNDWNEFVACAKTLSVARCQTAQVQTCAPRVPTGPWTFNSH
jgi:hypothetical protein